MADGTGDGQESQVTEDSTSPLQDFAGSQNVPGSQNVSGSQNPQTVQYVPSYSPQFQQPWPGQYAPSGSSPQQAQYAPSPAAYPQAMQQQYPQYPQYQQYAQYQQYPSGAYQQPQYSQPYGPQPYMQQSYPTQQYSSQPQYYYAPQPYQVPRQVQVRPAKSPAYLEFMKRHRAVFSRIGWALVITILLWNALAEVLITSFGPGLQKLGMGKEDVSNVLGELPLYLVAMPLSLLLFRSLPKVHRRTSSMKPVDFLKFFTMIFPVATIGGVIGSVLSSVLSLGGATDRLDDLSNGNVWISVLFGVILAPIFEELFFRRLIIDHTQQYGEVTAIVFSSVAFGLYHTNLYQFFYATAFGMMLAYVYVRTGRLRYTIALHILFNLFGSGLSELLTAGMSTKLTDAMDSGEFGKMQMALATGGPAVYGYLLLNVFEVVMFFAGIIVFVVSYNKLKFYKAPDELPKKDRVSVVMGNPGVIVALILLVCMTFLAVWMD